MAAPSGLLYAKTHEWVHINGDIARVGITDHAQEKLGGVALVQLPEVGRALDHNEIFGEIESIKAVSELYAPLSGEVVATNDEFNGAPEQVNSDPYGKGWMIEIRIKNPAELEALLNEAAYATFAEEAENVSYIPNTAEDQRAMLDAIGVQSIDDLFTPIPEFLQVKNPLAIPSALDQISLTRHFRNLAAQNASAEDYPCFREPACMTTTCRRRSARLSREASS